MAVATAAAIVAAVVAVVGTAVSAVGMYQQGKAQEKVANYNAKIAENAAISQRYQAEAQASRIRDRAKRLKGAQISSASKSGITLSGSANDVMYDSALAAENDVLTSLYQGKTGADSSMAQASLARFEGNQARSNSYYGISSTILSGVTESAGYANDYSQAKQKASAQPKIA